MFPPASSLQLDISAISGISGSISIACWVVVFSPQIIKNFQRHSAEGLSVVFIIVWLLGDIFNILGAVLQGVLPTMIILAVYYTLADIVLLCQLWFYRGFVLQDDPVRKPPSPESLESGDISPSETTRLLGERNRHATNGTTSARAEDADRRPSFVQSLLRDADPTHLSPANPAVASAPSREVVLEEEASSKRWENIKAGLFNLVAVLVVCAAGVLGWWLSNRHSYFDDDKDAEPDDLHFNILGQVFGYVCAVLYLASRVPQLLLNYRRKSTEGLSLLFFLFACIGNLTYVLSIFAYAPVCERPRKCKPGEAGAIYGKYIAVNASWLIGSLGTLFLDAAVFVQYFLYNTEEE